MPRNDRYRSSPKPASNRIYELRTAQGLTGRNLAERLDVDESTVSRWANGIYSIPDHYKQHLAEIFEVPVAYLMRWGASDD